MNADGASLERRHVLSHRLLVAALVCYGMALVIAGARLHPIAVAGGEYDLYAERAEKLLAGELANDLFHGMLVPELIAAATCVVGDVFAAGRVVASAAAVAVVYLLHRLTQARFGAGAAAWTTALLVVNAPFAILGVQVISDGVAAALLLGALAAWRGDARWPRFLGAGVCVGLAAAARPSLLAVAPLFALAGRWRGAGPVLAGVVLGYLPHAVPTWVQFGSPFANENWRVLASKAAGWDLAPLTTPTHDGLLALLAEHGGFLLRRGVSDFGVLWGDAMPSWLAGRPDSGAVRIGVAVLLLASFVWLVQRRDRRDLLPLGVVLVHSAVVAFAYRPDERTLLPIAPLALAWLVAGLGAFAGERRWLRDAACAALGAVVVWSAIDCWHRFAAAHATADVAAAARLAAREGPTVTVATLYPQLSRHAGVRSVLIEEWVPVAVWAKVEAAARDGVEWFVASRATCWSFDELVARAPATVSIEPRDDGVLVAKLPKGELEWLEAATVERTAGAAGLELRIVTRAVADLVTAGFTVVPPAGAAAIVPLARAGATQEFRGAMPLPAGARGRWRFVPTCLLADGQVRRGAAVELDLP